MTSRYVAVTSIPPLRGTYADDERIGHAKQSLAIDSLSRNGFSVISVNRASEIAGLKTHYPKVVFRPSDDFRGIFAESYGPSLSSLFDACGRSDHCAIVNADIYMIGSSIRRRMAEEPNVFFVARRVDVSEFGGVSLGIYNRGIDAAFFSPPRFAPLIADDAIGALQLGASYWDTVLPVVASFHGDVVFLRPPFILHAAHDRTWSRRNYARVREAATRAAYAHAVKYAEVSEAAARFLAPIDSQIGRLPALTTYRHIKAVVSFIDQWLKAIEVRNSQTIDIDAEDAVYRASQGDA